MNTYGEFIRLAREFEESQCRTFFVAEYTEDPEEEFENLRESVLTEDLVLSFVRDIQQRIRGRLFGICTEELYNTIYSEGHTFLGAIHGLASKLGVKLSAETTDSPINLVDMLLSRGYARFEGEQN